MSLRFILGAAGSGKTHTCLQEIAQALLDDGWAPEESPQLYFLVPEQATFQMERALLDHPGLRASARARVVSFKRWAHLALERTGPLTRPVLGETGRLLALQAATAPVLKELKVFQSAARTKGFLEQLAQTVRELRSYRHDQASLEKALELLAPSAQVKAKIEDLLLLLKAYERFLADRAQDPDAAVDMAVDALSASGIAKGAHVWIDGFAGFTPQEYAFLGSLMKAADKVSIALCIDPAVLPEGGVWAWNEGRADALFHPTQETLIRLRDLAAEQGVPLEDPLTLPLEGGAVPRFVQATALNRLERALVASWGPVTPQSQQRDLPHDEGTGEISGEAGGGELQSILMVEAPDRRGEVDAAAAEITRLVREHHYRYSDIAIIVRDMEPYRQAIETLLPQWDIPYFLDTKESAYHHPLVTLVRAAAELAAFGPSMDALLRCLKTDLLPVKRDDVDQLENEALRRGLDTDPWVQGDVLSSFDGDVADRLQDSIDRILVFRKAWRDHFDQTVESDQVPEHPSSQVLDGAGSKRLVRHLLKAMYRFLEESGAKETMESWIDRLEREGAPREAQVHRQVWRGVCDLLDQIDLVLGERTYDENGFMQVLEAGLERLQIGKIPPRVDQVLVGSVERSRQPNLKAIILLGCNDGHFPAVPEEDAFFSDSDRAALDEVGFPLGPGSRERLFHERYLAYIALTRASKRLIVSYSRSDDAGRPLRPSPLVSWLRRTFPNAPFRAIPAAGRDMELPQRPSGLRPWLVQRLRSLKEGDRDAVEQRPQLVAAYEWMTRWERENGGWRDFGDGNVGLSVGSNAAESYWNPVDPLLALTYTNDSRPLTSELIDALYGNPMFLSPSALEDFGACSFKHFAAHGLKLQERPQFRLDAALMGSLSHEVMKRFVERLWQEDRDWAELTREEGDAWIDDILVDAFPIVVGETIGLDQVEAAQRFAVDRLQSGLKAAVWALGEHARKGQFRPSAVEVSFGPRGALSPLVFEVGGKEVWVQGRIDRLDKAESGGTRYVRVIDYKSSRRPFRLSSVLYGIDLQLGIYLLAISEADASFTAGHTIAGCLYIPVFDPLVSLQTPEDEMERLWLKELKSSGLILDDGVAPRLMDGEASRYSDLVPAEFKKDGTLGARSSAVSFERMETFLTFVRGKMEELAAGIAAGTTSILPYELSGNTPCNFCQFKPVCQFDSSLPDNQYRRLQPLKDKPAWERISAEAAGQISSAETVRPKFLEAGEGGEGRVG